MTLGPRTPSAENQTLNLALADAELWIGEVDGSDGVLDVESAHSHDVILPGLATCPGRLWSRKSADR